MDPRDVSSDVAGWKRCFLFCLVGSPETFPFPNLLFWKYKPTLCLTVLDLTCNVLNKTESLRSVRNLRPIINHCPVGIWPTLSNMESFLYSHKCHSVVRLIYSHDAERLLICLFVCFFLSFATHVGPVYCVWFFLFSPIFSWQRSWEVTRHPYFATGDVLSAFCRFRTCIFSLTFGSPLL